MLYRVTLYFTSPLDGHFSLYMLNCSFEAYLFLLMLLMLVANLSCNFVHSYIWHGGGPMFNYAILIFNNFFIQMYQHITKK